MPNSEEINKSSIKEKFLKLKETWLTETSVYSDSNIIFLNKSYQEIIKLGYSVVPFIIEDMRNEPHHWFQALTKITNVDPISEENRGNLIKMTEDWLSYYDHR